MKGIQRYTPVMDDRQGIYMKPREHGAWIKIEDVPTIERMVRADLAAKIEQIPEWDAVDVDWRVVAGLRRAVLAELREDKGGA